MTITLNGTTGITTPDITSAGSLNIDASAPDNSLVVNSAGNVGIGTSPAVKLDVVGTINSTGLAVTGAISATEIISANKGITFPATQVASANANTLDDYEEGTWTPNQGAGLTVVGAFSSEGSYTKIGRVLTLRGKVVGATSVAVAADSKICSNTPIGATLQMMGVMIGTFAQTGTVICNDADIWAGSAIPATASITFSITYFVVT